MARNTRFSGVGITVGSISVILSLMTACMGATEPRRSLPVEGDSVVVRPVGSTPTEPGEGVVRCDVERVVGSVCWIVTDSVRP